MLSGSPNPDPRPYIRSKTHKANVREYSPGDFRRHDDYEHYRLLIW